MNYEIYTIFQNITNNICWEDICLIMRSNDCTVR